MKPKTPLLTALLASVALACCGAYNDAGDMQAGEGTGILVSWRRDSRWTYCMFSDSFVLTLKGFQICPGTD